MFIINVLNRWLTVAYSELEHKDMPCFISKEDLSYLLHTLRWGFPGSSATKNLPASQEPQEMQFWSLGGEDPLEEDTATHPKHSCLENPVMPKSQNLPMTTREPISDAKAREFLLPSSSWGSHRYRRSSYREEPWALGYIAYIGYSRVRNLKNGSFWVGRRLIGYLLWKG